MKAKTVLDKTSKQEREYETGIPNSQNTHKDVQATIVCVKSKAGEKITNKAMITEIWREYCEELYADNEEVEKEKTYTVSRLLH